MGRSTGNYIAEFTEGSVVRIADSTVLEHFSRSWKFHHPLQENQLNYAGKVATVKKVMFYHGGDELYELEGIPGIWHEQCLTADL
jgi:hypothetical protein